MIIKEHRGRVLRVALVRRPWTMVSVLISGSATKTSQVKIDHGMHVMVVSPFSSALFRELEVEHTVSTSDRRVGAVRVGPSSRGGRSAMERSSPSTETTSVFHRFVSLDGGRCASG